MKKAELETPDPTPAAPAETAAVPEALVPVEPTPLTLEQLEDLKARATKADDAWERLVRTTADFENFKKRAARERQEAARFANESLIQKLIPVLDNFEMALGAAQSAGLKSKVLSLESDAEPNRAERPETLDARLQTLDRFQAGIAMIQQQLKGVLADAGVAEVDATGQPFDPHLHEAVS